ncbi:MAG TPA: hypothetical protein D7H85_03410 [Candidatus Poseidoniales archaeon]|nr:MAG TPA: hypothetical protein D7H85_03410 [Candidatus Poseidoniales archaeon]
MDMDVDEWLVLILILASCWYIAFVLYTVVTYRRGRNIFHLTQGGLVGVLFSGLGLFSIAIAEPVIIGIFGVFSLILFFGFEGGWPSQIMLRDSTDFDIEPSNLDNMDGVIIILGILGMPFVVTPYIALVIVLLRRRFSQDGRQYFVTDRSTNQTRTEAILSLAGVHTSEDAFFIIRSAIKQKGLDWMSVFEGMDANEDGRIDRKEFTNGLQALIGTEVAPLTAYTILKAIDLDDDGTIDPEEFSIALAEEKSTGDGIDSEEHSSNEKASKSSTSSSRKPISMSISASSILFTMSMMCSIFLLLHSSSMLGTWTDAVEVKTRWDCMEGFSSHSSSCSNPHHGWSLDFNDGFHYYMDGDFAWGENGGSNYYYSNSLWDTYGPYSPTMYNGYMSNSDVGIDSPYPWILTMIFSIGAICLSLHLAYRIGKVYSAELARRSDEIKFIHAISLNPNALNEGKVQPLLPVAPEHPPQYRYRAILVVLFLLFTVFAASSYYKPQRTSHDSSWDHTMFQFGASNNQEFLPMMSDICGGDTFDSCNIQQGFSDWQLEVTIGLLLQMLIMWLAIFPVFIVVRDNDNSSEALTKVAPISSALEREYIPSVSELGGVFAEEDGSLQMDKVLEMLEEQIREAREEAHALKDELQETKEQIVVLEETIEKKDVELTEMSQVRDEVATITENIVAEGGDPKFNIQDSAFSGDFYAGSNRIGTQVINDPSEIAKAVIEAYKAGRKERSVDD